PAALLPPAAFCTSSAASSTRRFRTSYSCMGIGNLQIVHFQAKKPYWRRQGVSIAQKTEVNQRMAPLSHASYSQTMTHATAVRRRGPQPRTARIPHFGQPMLCSLVAEPFDDPNWIFEPKLDGLRVHCAYDGTNITLISRNNKPQNLQF